MDTTLVQAAMEAVNMKAAMEIPAPEVLKRWYQVLHLGRVLDDKAPNYLKQAI